MTTASDEHADANELKPTNTSSAAATTASGNGKSAADTDAHSAEDPGWCALDISFIASGETMLVRVPLISP